MTTRMPAAIRRAARSRPARDARALVSDLTDAFARNDLLTKASAISYQVLFALIPAALAGIAVLGFLGLEEYWRSEVAPTVQDQVSPEAFAVIRRSVERVLSSRELFWVTFGVGLALWEVSGAVRAGTGALNAILGADDRRPFAARMARSVLIAAAVAVLLGAALAGLLAGPELVAPVTGGTARTVLAPLARYAFPAAAALAAIGVLARFAPADPRPLRWVGVTSLATAAAWIAATLLFRLYVIHVASYSSIFGGLASAIVLMTYLYISAIVFLAGFQLDVLLRRDGAEACSRDDG
jgi:membrane protein